MQAVMRSVVKPLSLAVLGAVVAGSAGAQTYETLVDNGASRNRMDMIFIGDGYRASELDTTYTQHINSTLAGFFESPKGNPLGRYKKFFNVHRVNVASNQSGADDLARNITVDTALDAVYSTAGHLRFDDRKANNAMGAALFNSGIDTDDVLLGLVNAGRYIGSGSYGGSWTRISAAYAKVDDVALHETGHTFGLADEYYSFRSNRRYVGPEIPKWNVTTDPALGKWDRWLGYEDPDAPEMGSIGYYEGAQYYEFGKYRPSSISKMRSPNRPFDAVGREKIIHDIYEEVSPLDRYLSNDVTLTDPVSLWVETVDAQVINVEWFVDGESQGVLGESLDLASLSLLAGEHVVKARAYDAILDHAFTGDSMDWWRLDAGNLEQSISWNVVVVPEPATAGMTLVMLTLMRGCRRRRA